MKLKPATYYLSLFLIAALMAFASPVFGRHAERGVSPVAQKRTSPVSIWKQDINITQKHYSHQIKSRFFNSVQPVQRCIKTLKI